MYERNKKIDPESNNLSMYEMPRDFNRSFGFAPKRIPFLSLKSDVEYFHQIHELLFLNCIIDSTFDEFLEIFKKMMDDAIERKCFNPDHNQAIFFHDFFMGYYTMNFPFEEKDILKPEDLLKIWNFKEKDLEVGIYCCGCLALKNFRLGDVKW